MSHLELHIYTGKSLPETEFGELNTVANSFQLSNYLPGWGKKTNQKPTKHTGMLLLQRVKFYL